MAVRVGITVQHHQRVIGAENCERVAKRVRGHRIAEDAGLAVAFRRRQVGVSPGSEEDVHCMVGRVKDEMLNVEW